jgi:hypothetical protein
VRDHHDEGLVGSGHGGRVVLGALLELVAEQGHQRLVVGGHQAQRSRLVLEPRVRGVRQPLEPVPLGEPLLVGEQRDAQLVRGVEGRQLADHGAQQFEAGLRLAGELDAGEVAQAHGDRHAGHRLVRVHEAAQRDRAQRLEVLDRLGLRRDDLEGGAAAAEADAHPAEVVVRGAALPQPRARGDRPQGDRLRVVPGDGEALLLRGLLGELALLGEVAQVVAALGAHPPLAVHPGPVELAEAHGDHGRAHHAGHHVRGRGTVGHREHQRHGAHAERHRQHADHGSEVRDGGFAEHRRLGHLDPALRHGRPGDPWRPLDDLGAHEFPRPPAGGTLPALVKGMRADRRRTRSAAQVCPLGHRPVPLPPGRFTARRSARRTPRRGSDCAASGG